MNKISKNMLLRLPLYITYLQQKLDENETHISAPKIAKDLGFNHEQVRKDLALVTCDGGKPKVGRDIRKLIQELENVLAYKDLLKGVIVGTGHLGVALMNYRCFNNYGMEIVCAFDNDTKKINSVYNNIKIYSIDSLESICKENKIEVGIITVPIEWAQQIADLLVKAGVRAIWNFAPTHLTVPNNVVLHNENMAASIAIISQEIKSKEIFKEL